MKCIITEKPSVARDIARVLGVTQRGEGYLEGNGYLITWALGHLITLAMPESYGYGAYQAEDLPISPKPFQLIVRQIRKDKVFKDDPLALKQLKVIRSCFERADSLIVATDAGREGELIFRWIYKYLACQKPFERLWISSLTDKAILAGLAELQQGSKYDALYRSAEARAEADWLVGINASRALSIARRGGYSLGRVQTPTLAMLCRRYLEYQGFKTENYWRLSLELPTGDITLNLLGKERFQEEGQAEKACQELRREAGLRLQSIQKKQGRTPPPLLYDLTALQKEANKGYAFSADKTLGIAQRLYELKLTTYPRTGSAYISEDLFEEVPELLVRLGLQVPKELNHRSVDNSKVTDHHAIIPTGETAKDLSRDEELIYKLIVQRFAVAFSPESEEERMTLSFEDSQGHLYEWRGKRQKFLGWKALLDKGEKSEETEDAEAELTVLPLLQEGAFYPFENCTPHAYQTKPKPLYTEASLLTAMEHAGREVEDEDSRRAIADCGIGTPATRANIIETLLLRDYIRREKKQLLPTEKGLAVYDIIKDKRIASAETTGQWELALAAVEAGASSAEAFMERIKEYSEQICVELLALNPPEAECQAYACPKCQERRLRLFPKVLKCLSEGCGFIVFRELSGQTLSEEHLKALVEKGATPFVKGLRSKAGKSYTARLVLQGDGSTALDFKSKKKS